MRAYEFIIEDNPDYDEDRYLKSDPGTPLSFPKGTTLVNVSDVYDWYKLGMAVSDLDDADPRTFNKGVPHTVFAFGSEEEEHKMIPLLKRLGFSLHDIDNPKDYAKAIRADEAISHLEEMINKQVVTSGDLTERKKRKRRNKSFSGYWYPGYGYYGSGAYGSESGDGGGGESITETKNSNVIYIGDNVAIVGQEHGKRLQLSDQDAERVRAIAQRHGAWYEGNGMDRKLTKGIIDDYQGSWDDDLLSSSIKGYPAPFLYVLFSNIKENDTVEGKIGFDPNSTIFDRILNTQPNTNYFPDRKFNSKTLQQFLQSVSEGSYNFVQMSQKPATESNVRQFFKLGEQLMWPDNWEQYPNRAGRVAKSVNDLRDKFLATRKQGVYVAGSDHLKAVQQFLKTFENLNEELPDLPMPKEKPANYTAQTSVDPNRRLQRAQYSDLNTGLNLGVNADQPVGPTDYESQRGFNVGYGRASVNVGDKGHLTGSYNIPIGKDSSVSLSASGNKDFGVTGVGAQYQRGGFSAGVNQGNYPGAKPQFNVGYSAQFENDENLDEELRVDVPNEEWLQDQIDYAIERGRNRNGVPYMGKGTAYAMNVQVPVDILKRLPGMSNEQQNIRKNDLDAIIKIMRDTGKLPLSKSGGEYLPFINVAYNGEAWVNEGNHRIMAAAKLGLDSLPIEIRYFDGGERIKHGAMYPPKIGLA
jgi:phage gp37-like protein